MTVRPWLCSIALALGVGASSLSPTSAAAQEPAAEPPAAPADDPAAAPSSPDAPASDPAAVEPSAEALPATSATAEPMPEEGAAPAAAADEPPPAPGVGSYEPAEPPRATAPEPESSTDWPYVGGWVSWGVGAAVLTVFHYAFFSLNGVVRDDAMKSYRDGVLEGESSCDQARAGVPSSADGAASPQEVADLCDEADTMETLRNVTLPFGLAAAVLGLVLIGTSDTVNGDSESDEQAGAWRLRFGAGPQGGGATVQVSF